MAAVASASRSLIVVYLRSVLSLSLSRRQAELERAIKLLGENALAVLGNVTIMEDQDRLYGAVQEQVGRLDVLVANSRLRLRLR